MAKRKQKNNVYELSKGLTIAFSFMIPAAGGIAILGTLFSWAGIAHAYEYVTIGFAVPSALALIYRWQVGKWPTGEDGK